MISCVRRFAPLWAALLFLAGCSESSAPPPPANSAQEIVVPPAPPRPPVEDAAPVSVAPPAASAKPPAPASAAKASTSATAGALPSHYKVKFVKDGDSITLDNGKDLRYIGIDTPEHGQPFADEARDLNRSLVQGKEIRVEYDQETHDVHGRVLAYVYVTVEEGGKSREVFVNAEMLRRSLARVYAHEKTCLHQKDFLAIQREVMTAKQGVWSVVRAMDVPYYIGTRKGKAYHRPDCENMKNLPASALQKYTSREEAERAGKTACRGCKP